jgi:uncharacterized protein (TIGR03437 family)
MWTKMMRTNWLVRAAGLVLAGLLAVPALFGTTYTYTKIIDNAPGSALGLVEFPTYLINGNGAVAFTATGNANGIYTGSASGISPVVTNDSSHFLLSGFNDSGTVVYYTGGGVNSATAGGTPFVVAQNATSILFPVINNAGTVAFGGPQINSSIQTRTGSGPVQTLVSDTDLPRAVAFSAPSLSGLSINNSGTVAFYASSVMSGTSCNCGIYTAGPGAPVPVAPFQQTLTSAPQINDKGAVAFVGVYQTVKGVFVASGGQIAAAVDLGSQVVSFAGGNNNVSLNSKGEVVYWAKFGISPFVQGMFTGPDKVADKVISNGDPLFGSVVSEIISSQFAGRLLNDSGQVVFSYRLSNGVSGIAVATPVSSSTPPPTLSAGGILNAASFALDSAPVAPGSIVSIFGSHFISELAVPPGDPLPTSLGGVSVTFNGTPAPLFFVAPAQINAQVPFEVTGSTATVQVTNPAGTSNTETVNITPQSPAIFTVNQNGVGQAVVVFANSATIVGPVKTGSDQRPAKTGDTITIYANGLGAVNPPINDGWNSCDKSICAPDFSNLTLRSTTVRPVVTIGGVPVPDTSILFSGFTPLFAGLYQINLTIPGGITPSNQLPVVIQMGKTSSPQNVNIAMQ